MVQEQVPTKWSTKISVYQEQIQSSAFILISDNTLAFNNVQICDEYSLTNKTRRSPIGYNGIGHFPPVNRADTSCIKVYYWARLRIATTRHISARHGVTCQRA